jgi:UDP-N-acetylglucosamine diphosphorylase / glucose-1-phosphate thymidylyltransferase / UDP-N-acetylgalactosamine diphosphorylase / glucosamine-1-phosphate N-acetyltransferase / galactosamine-1-phosphate N-acetyltransferase
MESMQELSTQQYFSFENFSHRGIFENTTYAWEPLQQLAAYLGKQQLGKIEVEIPSTVYLINPELISIGAGTVVEPGAYIQGPVIIGPENTIRHGAYVRGHVITGRGCMIGHATEVKHSILLDRAQAGHFNYVGDSILGNDVNLGAGAKLANFRLDHEEVTILYKGEKIRTQLRKLGALIGDGAQIGCNVVTNPGTLIGPRAFCYPCNNIKGIIPSKAIYQERL